MSIGLIPLIYNEHNYGGVLQFYALQQILQKIGFECKIVYVKDESKVCTNRTGVKGFVLKVIRPYLNRKNNKNRKLIHQKLSDRYRRIDVFKDDYYVETVDLESCDIQSFEAFICGSDQIWNPEIARNRCFLKFVPDSINKVIYAASLGCESLTEQQKKNFAPLIERLDHVSVREKSAKKILNEFVSKEIVVALDPTLLLPKNDWMRIQKKPREIDAGDKYLFTYFLGDYAPYKRQIDAVARNNDLIIVNIPFASGERVDTEDFGDVQIIDATPDEFLYLINHAECVLTDSFHACVFSVLFERNFFVYKRGGSGKMMGRINTLLDNFGLKGRIITAEDEISISNTNDYSKNEEILRSLSQKSIGFLKESLKNEGSH